MQRARHRRRPRVVHVALLGYPALPTHRPPHVDVVPDTLPLRRAALRFVVIVEMVRVVGVVRMGVEVAVVPQR